jgi:hypothetical protein
VEDRALSTPVVGVGAGDIASVLVPFETGTGDLGFVLLSHRVPALAIEERHLQRKDSEHPE